MSILIFKAGTKDNFAMNLLSISEIVKRDKLSNFPGSSPYVSGVVDIRGKIIVVVDLPRLLFGVDIDTASTNLIILDRPAGGAYAFKATAVDRIIKDTDNIGVHENRMRKYTREILTQEDGTIVQMLDVDRILDCAVSGCPIS